jgi:hypothetical protein
MPYFETKPLGKTGIAVIPSRISLCYTSFLKGGDAGPLEASPESGQVSIDFSVADRTLPPVQSSGGNLHGSQTYESIHNGNGVYGWTMMDKSGHTGRVESRDEDYRLYLDESGDHVFRDTAPEAHRFLCLLGCWFQGKHYRAFHDNWEAFKQRHIPHNPDEPVILHREDIINKRKCFWRLRDPYTERAFNADLLDLIDNSVFRFTGVIIDKYTLRTKYEAPAHPYHLGLGFMLQRYCGHLNYINRRGDVMAEGRGGLEDRLLKSSYAYMYERGAWMRGSIFFQRALTSKELKIKPKSANVAGLQLSDLLCHTVKRAALIEKGLIDEPLSPFARELWKHIKPKLNRHESDGRTWGYGLVLFPQ